MQRARAEPIGRDDEDDRDDGDRADAAEACLRRAAALPKVVLHEHLDGALRIGTVRALLAERGIAPPAADEAALARWFDDNAHAGSLERYLEGFALTVAAMASPEALARAAREAAEDALADGAVLAEFRIAPLLFEPFGIAGDAVVEALLAGLAQCPALPCGLIVCALRHLPEAETLRAARLALRWAGRDASGADGSAGPRVVGFDLAGAERGHPCGEHADALALVRHAGLPLTLHAGEADAAERVLEAARHGARRIGHGVRLVDALADPARRHLVDEVRALGLHLEVCPSSNVHTGAATSIAAHPITALWRAGVSLSVHTDNPLFSRTSMSGEFAALLSETSLTEADLLTMTRQAAAATFLGASARERSLRRIDEAAAELAQRTEPTQPAPGVTR
ncbi:MAG: adenosine deaminase family protein [Betaproteobacteria bacterium]|nr:adenosine deaminase family protein [Betaproteobacteria bacterium]MCC6248715.1 adenosine deaminase family protein [Rubrivivax sp.]